MYLQGCIPSSSSTRFVSSLCVAMGGSIVLQGPTTMEQHMHGGQSTCLVIQVCPGADYNGESIIKKCLEPVLAIMH